MAFVCYLFLAILVIGQHFGECHDRLRKKSYYKQEPSPNPILGSKFSRDDSIILVSTLEGSLIALSKTTGAVKWKLAEEPVIKLSNNKELAKAYNLLPDPKDGSLYMLGSGTESLTKLPFTIPELVAASPSHGSDGMLYMGKKLDTWLMIDPLTGEKQEILSFQGLEKACPRDIKPLKGPSIFLGRTEYSLVLLDSHTREKRWNVTFFDYTSSTHGLQDPQEYDLAHFTASSTGKILTLDRHTGDLLWQQDLNSPIVGIYGLIHDISKPSDGIGLIATPFTSLSVETLLNLSSRLRQTTEEERRVTGETQLFPVVHIGEYRHGLYAIPSLVDELSSTVAAGILLLEGPGTDTTTTTTSPLAKSFVNVNLRLPHDKSDWMVPYHSIASKPPNSPQPPILFFELSSARINPALNVPDDGQEEQNKQIKDEESIEKNWTQHPLVIYGVTFFSLIMGSVLLHKLLLVGVKSFWYSTTTSSSSEHPRDNISAEQLLFSTAVELKNGLVQIGKIVFSPTEILGKGCEGTFVYKGKYDGRNVAVKRLLPECFIVAEREVSLLRESDTHPHVIRYFCTEQDRQFKYIALELCVASLQDYIENRYNGTAIDGITILRHATAGIAHLHSLDIVHRDVKPQNVLISPPNAKGEVRAMISDFGLCKKLKIGRMSFSRRSGVAGTEGWIAPEMMTNDGQEVLKRTTCAVDIFSLGLLYFYVISKGLHPFGDVLRRQANILSGEYDLSVLLGNVTAHTLIEKMLSFDPLERPPARAVLKHPIFWSCEKVLAFFQDVSDRVEKDSTDSAVLQSLERAAHDVVRGSWRVHLEEIVMQDLRRHRTYQGRSVRDLLRALRNKKNHYREVSDEVKRVMGRNPEEFCEYWTSKFPKLLMHSWYAMHCVKNEHIFSRYYDKQYDFIQKYIVWPTPKPKSDFHKALETAFPVYDALFQKSKPKESQNSMNEDKPGPEDNVVENWEHSTTEDVQPTKCEEYSRENSSETETSEEGRDGAHLLKKSNSEAQSIETKVVDTNDHSEIVLGPGGQWGVLQDRNPVMARFSSKINSDVSSPVAAWSLPTARNWEFSEITHHARRKQKSLLRKKKKNEDQ